MHELLAASSIFVVQSPVNYDSPMPILIQEHLHKTLCKNRLEKIDPHLATRLKDIICELRDGTISKIDARLQLLQLSNDIDGPSKNVVLAIESLVTPLKYFDVQELSETEILISFVHPFIQAIFVIHDGNRVARCAGEIHLETDMEYCPDYIVDFYERYVRKYTTCFGEVKGDNTDDRRAVYGFYSLAIFSKQQMDKHGLTDILSFRTTGLSTTFFIMNHIHPSVYTITELVTIDIPRSLSQFHKIISEFDQLLTIATVHQEITTKHKPYTPTSTLSLDYGQHKTET
ncbi:hypothetical protein CLU79DRAFT_791775 [Phycomyces nitens]|nr:hypothetical protein CLU79DRAFT_791775 [Phycomyces nitens]